MTVRSFGLLAALALAWQPFPAAAQDAAGVSVEPLDCVPLMRHSIVKAKVEGDLPGHTLRLYFRRLNQEVEDFYWVQMQPFEGGYWAALPQPEDHSLTRYALSEDADAEPPQLESDYRWAAWWKAKELSRDRDPNGDLDDELIEERAQVGKEEVRDWMLGQDDRSLEDWLEGQVNEPVEYYATLVDSYGNEAPGTRSPTLVAPVVDAADCPGPRPRNEREQGAALNLTIGETSPWQDGEEPFHWACHGVVTRVDSEGVLRADQKCRACVIGFFPARAAAPAAVIAGAGVIVTSEPPNPSPTAPGPR